MVLGNISLFEYQYAVFVSVDQMINVQSMNSDILVFADDL